MEKQVFEINVIDLSMVKLLDCLSVGSNLSDCLSVGSNLRIPQSRCTGRVDSFVPWDLEYRLCSVSIAQ